MNTYVIERLIPGAGRLDSDQLQAIAVRSCDVIEGLGPSLRWRESFVTGDSVFCIYEASDESVLREHARRGDFPADRILPVANVISPATAGRKEPAQTHRQS